MSTNILIFVVMNKKLSAVKPIVLKCINLADYLLTNFFRYSP